MLFSVGLHSFSGLSILAHATKPCLTGEGCQGLQGWSLDKLQMFNVGFRRAVLLRNAGITRKTGRQVPDNI